MKRIQNRNPTEYEIKDMFVQIGVESKQTIQIGMTRYSMASMYLSFDLSQMFQDLSYALT